MLLKTQTCFIYFVWLHAYCEKFHLTTCRLCIFALIYALLYPLQCFSAKITQKSAFVKNSYKKSIIQVREGPSVIVLLQK